MGGGTVPEIGQAITAAYSQTLLTYIVTVPDNQNGRLQLSDIDVANHMLGCRALEAN